MVAERLPPPFPLPHPPSLGPAALDGSLCRPMLDDAEMADLAAPPSPDAQLPQPPSTPPTPDMADAFPPLGIGLHIPEIGIDVAMHDGPVPHAHASLEALNNRQDEHPPDQRSGLDLSTLHLGLQRFEDGFASVPFDESRALLDSPELVQDSFITPTRDTTNELGCAHQ